MKTSYTDAFLSDPQGMILSINGAFKKDATPNPYENVTPEFLTHVGKILENGDFDSTFEAFSKLCGLDTEIGKIIMATYIFAVSLTVAMEIRESSVPTA